MPAMSCDRNGVAATSRSSPVPAWNKASRWATGKPHPLAWLPGWPKWDCNAGGVGHGERRAVDQEGAMAAPAADRLGVGDHGVDHGAEQGAEDGQGEPGPGLAEGAGGEGAAGQERDVGQGGVAVEDLDEEPMDNGRRGQEAGVAPGVSGGAAGGEDDILAELGGEVLSECVESGRNPAMHRGASCAMVVVTNTMVPGGLVFLKSCDRLRLAPA